MLQRVILPDGELSLFEAGPGQGEPLLFVHGFPLDHTMWGAQVEFFSRTHRCLAVDMRGFGQSSVQAGTVLMEKFADDLAALLVQREIFQPVTLCGLSMGGYVAWQFWKRHPAMLARLILCDTRAIADTEEGRKQRLETADQVERQGAESLADAMLPKLYAESTQRLRPDLIEAARRVILANSPTGIAAAARGMAERPDVSHWLPEISVPTLLLTGEQDVVSPVSEMATIAQAVPNARHVTIPQAGHMAPQEQPEQANAAISGFLAEPVSY